MTNTGQTHFSSTDNSDIDYSALDSFEIVLSDGEDYVIVSDTKRPLLNATDGDNSRPLTSRFGDLFEGQSITTSKSTFWNKMATVRSYLQARKQYLPTVLLLICVTLYLPYSYVSVLHSKEEHFREILGRSGFQRVANRSHAVFSAYLDDRFPREAAKVRILGFKDKKDSEPLYCKLYFQNNDAMCVNTPAIELRLDSKEAADGEIECLFHCTLPEQIANVPVAVTLTSSKTCASIDHAVPIHLLQGKPGRKKDIAVCFSSPSRTLTKDNENEILEIIELSRFFGASVVQMYNGSMSPELVNSMADSVKSGFLKILPWDLEGRNFPDLAKTLSINDCIYRNMAWYRNVVFVDKDQIVIPSNGYNSSWKVLIETMRRVNPGSGAFWFRDSIFVTEEGLPKGTKPQPLPATCPLDKFKRSELPRIFTHRFIVQPQIKSSQKEYKQLIVDPSVVLYVDTSKKVTFLPGRSSNYLPTEFGQGIHFVPYQTVQGYPAMETFRSAERFRLTSEINNKLPFTRKANLSGCKNDKMQGVLGL